MLKYILCTFSLALLCAFPSSARQLGSFHEFTASVADDFSCGQSITVRIESENKEAFTNNRRGLSKIVGLVRAAMSFECPQAKEIALDGYYLGQRFATTEISANSKWRLGNFQNISAPNPGPQKLAAKEHPATGLTESSGQQSSPSIEMTRPAWSPVDVPILKGSVAEDQANYPKLDLNRVPSFKGYELVSTKPLVCSNRLIYRILDRDGRGLGQASVSLNEATQYFGLYLSDYSRCPLLEVITFTCKPVCDGRSAFAVERRYDWHTVPMLNKLRKEKVAYRQKVVQAYENRPLPDQSTENPLGSRGYYASSFVAEFGNVTLYEAYQTQNRFYRRGAIFVMVHDLDPGEPIVRLTYDSFHGTYQTIEDFAKKVDLFVEFPSYRSSAPHNIRHYLKNFSSPHKMTNSSESMGIEAPLLHTSGRKFSHGQPNAYIPETAYKGDLEISLSDLTGAN